VKALKGIGAFTEEEDRLLAAYVESHGGKGLKGCINWGGVVDALNGKRNTMECQNRHHTLKRLSGKVEKDEKGSAKGEKEGGEEEVTGHQLLPTLSPSDCSREGDVVRDGEREQHGVGVGVRGGRIGSSGVTDRDGEWERERERGRVGERDDVKDVSDVIIKLDPILEIGEELEERYPAHPVNPVAPLSPLPLSVFSATGDLAPPCSTSSSSSCPSFPENAALPCEPETV
jgi:Myb-like DNA-binding domain